MDEMDNGKQNKWEKNHLPLPFSIRRQTYSLEFDDPEAVLGVDDDGVTMQVLCLIDSLLVELFVQHFLFGPQNRNGQRLV